MSIFIQRYTKLDNSALAICLPVNMIYFDNNDSTGLYQRPKGWIKQMVNHLSEKEKGKVNQLDMANKNKTKLE